MDEILEPSDLNDLARIAMLATRCKPELLDDFERFRQMVGRDLVAGLQRNQFDIIRRIAREFASRRTRMVVTSWNGTHARTS